jgi:ketosteroid isomerase-like protein
VEGAATVGAMDETQAFLDDVMPRQLAAELAIHNGDPGPRKAMWSHRDPLTLLGAEIVCVTGAEAVHAAFDTVASWFSDSTHYDIELIAAGASGDLAYTVVYEHSSCSRGGVPTTYRLRVTHGYRREDGEWRIVHRHADEPPGETAFSG